MSFKNFILSRLHQDLLITVTPNDLSVRVFESNEIAEFQPYIAIGSVEGIAARYVDSIGSKARFRSSNNIKVFSPFGNPRIVVDDIYVASKIIAHSIKLVHKIKILKPRPRVIICFPKFDEFSVSEEFLIKKMLTLAGARDGYLYKGNGLDLYSSSFDSAMNNITRR